MGDTGLTERIQVGVAAGNGCVCDWKHDPAIRIAGHRDSANFVAGRRANLKEPGRFATTMNG
jgi:hypothetical protein